LTPNASPPAILVLARFGGHTAPKATLSNVPAYTIAILILGVLTMAVGGIMQLVAAFRQSIVWGLASLFLPLASLIFTIVHWAEAKAGFFTGLAGTALLVCGVLTSEPIRTAYASGFNGKTPFSFKLPGSVSTAETAKDLNAQIQEKRDRIEQLEAQFGQAGAELVAQFQTLTTQRNSLRTDDAAATATFNAAAATYQALNTAQKERQQELAKVHRTLDTLLVERTKQQAAAAGAKPGAPATGSKQSGAAAGTGSKKVVMYTTSSCPACKSAKQYFARKGVHYEEYDVNASPAARQEFQRLGGTGVPLILVGDEKVLGFSEQRLNQLL
jgi:glutaredoxin